MYSEISGSDGTDERHGVSNTGHANVFTWSNTKRDINLRIIDLL